jgi:LuxR family maltose regulon positive regulatory protein
MGKTATVRNTRSLQRRRIIQRPRLLALLDESTAPVRALVAAAGYGKTTLAEQWVASAGRRSAWYTARRSSIDVAALALGVARAASTIVEGCEVRLREHLRAVSAPAGNVFVLVEILSEELEAWPSDAWLVIDDYQELAGPSDSETFVAELVAGCPLQVLLTSRQRPSWVTARSMLYGEVLELNQTALAMDNHEAAEVLADWSGPSASGLVALANGWPAVIGLASVAATEIEGDDAVPESLYRFFAEEVFDALGDQVREGIAVLAVAPVIDRELAAELLGDERAEEICTAALDVGILVERNARLDLHPLARSFLEERSGATPAPEAVARCLAHYKARRDWDAAFDVIARRGAVLELEPLLLEALDDLLETARLSTIEAWCDFARRSGIDAPAFSLARAETALRLGRHAQAQAFAESAAAQPALAFRALSVAGRSAHVASREEEALAFYRRAEASALTEADRRDSLWGQVICATELGLAEADTTLTRLSEGVSFSDPREVVRAVSCQMMQQTKQGSLDLSNADIAWELIDRVTDPLIESAFESVYANVLALSGRYADAREVAAALLSVARRYRLDFAAPYALASIAMAHVGHRDWEQAHACLSKGTELARAGGDLHAELNCYVVSIRAFAQEGKAHVALALPQPDLRPALPGIRAEVMSSRALVLASVGRSDEALWHIDQIGSADGIETAVLVPAVSAVISLKRRLPDTMKRVSELEDAAFSTGAVDLLVSAYRAAPGLLPMLLSGSHHRERFVGLLRKVGDEDLAEVAGHLPVAQDPKRRLTRREREVYGFLREGLSNRQIAEILVIEESTVKAHAHHIYDKLGVHSRTELAIQAALERVGQTTSATTEIAVEDR